MYVPKDLFGGYKSQRNGKKQNKFSNDLTLGNSAAKKVRQEIKNSLVGQNSIGNFMGDSSALELNLGNKNGQKFFQSDEITIWAWNVNGVRAMIKKKKLDDFFKSVNPEILCLSETKIDEGALADLKLERKIPKEYLQYWNCCVPPIKGYAGTAIFTKVIPLSVKYDIGIPKHDKEGRTITLEYEKFYLVAVYVPNAGSSLKWLNYRVAQWDVDFRNYLKSLELKGKPVILMGDLNVAQLDIDVYNPQGYDRYPCFTEEERTSFSMFKNLGFIDTFREIYPGKIKFSFWDVRSSMRKENKGWRLDYAIVSKSIFPAVVDSEIHTDIWGSDHCPISLTFDQSYIDLDDFKEDINFDENDSDDKSEMDFEEEEKINMPDFDCEQFSEPIELDKGPPEPTATIFDEDPNKENIFNNKE
ncbi:unnamed protein product [Moneuplotes crassus]|uniref:DNA-(apurinic or apyrimidinic site) endonuclease n=1 Tax=Euplotes crassus TaxID=5936 RepID=A0AAD1X1I8_EUPCR|nr:unnamed protein product [Moneuplotes crassus]